MIFDICPACRGEGGIPWGHRWSDGEPVGWEPCITCDLTGVVEVESEPLDGDEDEFFTGGKTWTATPQSPSFA